MRTQRASRSAQRQQGVATLVVVLIIFFVVSLVAAYTNRNLIFEQRTATNQYRSTQALEAAEAGLEWAVSMLNLGRVTDTCTASTDNADQPFRERYLVIATDGRITPADAAGAEMSAACVFNGTGWTCSCPTAGSSAAGVGTVTAPTSPGIWPAFRVRFVRVGGSGATPPPTVPPQPGVIKVEVVACTRVTGFTAVGDCLNFSGQGAAGEGRAFVSSLLALAGGPSSPPQAALVARDDVDVGGGSGFSAYNTMAGGSGITVQSGGNVGGYDKLVGPPGSPGGTATLIANDTSLRSSATSDGLYPVSGATGISTQDRMFAALFNARPLAIQQQQGAVAFDPGGADSISDVANRNPWRPIWVKDGADLAIDADVGSTSHPVLLVVNGDLTFTSSSAKIYGIVYIRTPSSTDRWNTAGAGQIVGAVVADKKVRGDGTTTFVFDPDVVKKLRWNTGSFVRVPASWKDFQ